MARGRMRIYLGAAPGVGKTYAMLEEGQRLGRTGADVVAGFVEPPPERPYDADVESPAGDNLTPAARGRPLSSDDQRVLGACAAQLGMAHSHGRLAERARRDRCPCRRGTHPGLTGPHGESRTAGPLRTAEESLNRLSDRLAGTSAGPVGPQAARLLDTAHAAVRRAGRLVTDLDDLSRLYGGALDLYLRPVDLDEALTAALDNLGPGGHTIDCTLPEQLPDVIADAAVLTRVLTSLAADALRHRPPDRPPRFTAEVRPAHLEIQVTDGATVGSDDTSRGGRSGRRTDSLPLRLSRDLTETMGGTLEPDAGGTAFAVRVTLPTAAPRTTVRPEPGDDG